MQEITRIHDVALPGLMLSQTWPTSREREGETLRALETALADGFFTSFQSVEVPYASERRRISELRRDAGVFWDYCIARVLNENQYNLSDLDSGNRRRSCEGAVKCLDEAREIGADAVTVVAGPVPNDPGTRGEALGNLQESLRSIAEEAEKAPSVTVNIEPLDVASHKRHTLGYTNEAVSMAGALRDEGLDVMLLLDSAHITLNGENPTEALGAAIDVTSAFHFCNCVPDPAHPMYGDRHLRFGPPGVLDADDITRHMHHQLSIGFLNRDRKRPIMCEVLRQPEDDSVELMRYCRDILSGAWAETQDATDSRSEGG